MQAGERLDGRFRLEGEIGRGSIGIVYRAIDETTNEPVAVKILAVDSDIAAAEEQRLLREAAILARLQHPNIVRVISAGYVREAGMPYVVMEWLLGEDLSLRQQRAPLSLRQSLAVAGQLCEALAAAHDAGIIHRDLKPANVFLCYPNEDRDTFQVKLVDFGVALTPELAERGDVAGTPAYMSPEQVRGEASIDARADLYALGALLFELIAGRPPHIGATRVATLARLATTRAPRLGEIKRDVPWPVDELVAKLLALAPSDRPDSARSVIRALVELSAKLDDFSEHDFGDSARSLRLGSSVSRLVTSMVAIHFADAQAREHALTHLLEHEADAVPLGQDAIIAHFGARRAQGTEARSALELGKWIAQNGSQVGVASGRARLHPAALSGIVQPVGEVVDRASALAREADRGVVLVDATTSELCRGRYEFRARDDGSAVVGNASQGARGAGGAPFVGREAELAQVLSGCERARLDMNGVLVTLTGPPGIGKSRLRREVLARITAQAEAPLIVSQRSESYARRHALGAAADVLRSLLELPKAAGASDVREAVMARLSKPQTDWAGDEGYDTLARLLANEELPSGNEGRGARDLLWLRMTELVQNACKARALAIVMEDLQWADPESIAFIDHALGQAALLPLCVIATMRPDFWVNNPTRFIDRDHVRLELGPISQRSTRALTKALLGDHVSDDTLEAIVRQSAGSPLFAEELARLAASGQSTVHTPTIEAAIQASLDALDEAQRDAVGRLSVFGLAGWDAGLSALGFEGAADALRALAAAEILFEQDSSRFNSAREWVFKHALVRDVAYNSLGDAERKSLHLLAAQWLAQAAEDATVVADHYDLGGDSAKAADYWAKAAQRALATNALSDALSMAERALASATDKKTGFHRARILDEAWSRLDPKASDRESAVWALEDNVFDEKTLVYALGARARYDNARGAGEDLNERLATVRDKAAMLGLHDEEARASAALATRLAFAGQLSDAESEAQRLLKLAQTQNVLSAAVDAWQTLAITRQTNGSLNAALDARRSATAAARSAGLREREAILTTNLGFALTTIGARQEARALLDQGLGLSEAIGSAAAVRHARMILLCWAASFGNDRRLDAALSQVRTEADGAASGMWTAPDRENLGTLYYRGCELLLFGGAQSLDRARQLLTVATQTYRQTENRDVLPVALGMCALAELRAKKDESALGLAHEASRLLENGAPSLLNESTVYLVLHDAYAQLERQAEARAAVEKGMIPLVRRVHGLRGTHYARMFLTELPHNAQLVSRAEAYGLLPDAISMVLEQGAS